MPLGPLVDCSAHDPGDGITCYTRPEFVVWPPACVGDNTEKYACIKHLGRVVYDLGPTDMIWVTRYGGA